MKKPPAFQFYPKDFLADMNVAIMTMEERGVYITLLCHLWLENKLPNEARILQGLCGYHDGSAEKWDQIWSIVGRCFYVKRGRLGHKRIDEERKKQTEWREKSSLGGQMSAQKRWGATPEKSKGGYKKPTTVAQPKGNTSSSSSSSSSIKDKEKDKEKEKKNTSSEPDSPTRSSRHIEYNFETRKWEGITEQDMAQWRDAAPACNIDLELKKMAAWLDANPKQKKKNYRRFVVNWLSRRQDEGGTREASAPDGKKGRAGVAERFAREG